MTESICLRADNIDLLDSYYTIEEDESVILLSLKSSKEISGLNYSLPPPFATDEPGFEIELVVIWGAAFKFEH